MVKSNTDALGIIFPNAHDSLVQELVAERTMASVPFGGRYRLVDFVLSSMVNSGISNVSIVVKQNYHSLMDHLGSGKAWDLSRKREGLYLLPPFGAETMRTEANQLFGLHHAVFKEFPRGVRAPL